MMSILMVPLFIENIREISLASYPGCILACQFCLEKYQDHDYLLAGITMPEQICTAVKKRKAEYLAGRYLAAKIMCSAGYINQQIAIGSNREPEWPVGVSGSLSHNNDTALCAISFNSSVHATGVDVETMMSEALVRDLATSIIDHEESRNLQDLHSVYPFLLTLAFSAKESLFKALYPYVKTYFDFSDVHLMKVDVKNQRMTLKLRRTLHKNFPEGYCFSGYYFYDSRSVITLIFF